MDAIIDSSNKNPISSEAIQNELEGIAIKLKKCLAILIGLPFFTELISKVTLILRKFSLLERVNQIADRKKIYLSDLHFIDSMKAE